MHGHDESEETPLPDRIIAACVRHTRGIALFDDVAVDVLHEEIGRQHAMDKVSPDIAIVKVVLEQRGDLCMCELPLG